MSSWRRAAPGSPPSGGPGTRAIAASIVVAQLGGHRRRRGVGDDRRVLRRGRRRRPSRGRASRARSATWIGRCSSVDAARGSGRASRASRSGRRCRRPRPSARSPAGSRSTGRACARARACDEPSERTKQPSSPRGRLDRVVDLARRHAEALGDELEVVDQRLHRGRQLVARRQRDLAVLGDVRALGQAVERLLDDLAPTP